MTHPHTEVRTEDARAILKKEIRLADAVRQWGNLAALVAALYNGDLELLGRSLQDVVAEPARSLLIPGFASVKKAAPFRGRPGLLHFRVGPICIRPLRLHEGRTGGREPNGGGFPGRGAGKRRVRLRGEHARSLHHGRIWREGGQVNGETRR